MEYCVRQYIKIYEMSCIKVKKYIKPQKYLKIYLFLTSECHHSCPNYDRHLNHMD